MNRASIRFRITAMASLIVVLVLVLTSLVVVLSQRSQLTATLDSSLRQRADDIATLVVSAEVIPVEFGAGGLEGFAQLIGPSGSVIASSSNLESSAALPIDYVAGSPEAIRTVTGLPVDDDQFRVLSRSVATVGGRAVLHVGTTYDVVGESTGALRTSLAIAIPIAVVLLGGLIWWLVGRTLRPVEDIRTEVAAIGAGNLGRRVSEPSTEDEIGLLAVTMNQMLDRIESSVKRQQEFAADASHELRGPLTRMRAEIEVDLLDEALPTRERLESVRDEVVALQRLVEDLLHLARSDSGRQETGRTPVDLDDLVMEQAQRLQMEGGVAVDIRDVSGAQVNGDRRQLARAISNLADNAARHAANLVSFSVREVEDSAVVAVADDGPGIAPDDVHRVFERFSRLDDSRSASSGGPGLGLAITRDIVERHGGSIVVDAAYTGGARIEVRIPLS